MHASHQASLEATSIHRRGLWLSVIVALALIGLSLTSNPNVWAASRAGDTGSGMPGLN